MDTYIDERDIKALKNDVYTFAVLRRIFSGKCELLLTDHERLIICFTCKPYPVWVWTPDDATTEEMENIYRIVTAHFVLNGEYRFNMKYSLADYFMKRARLDGKQFTFSMNMFAYDCLNPVKPLTEADGFLYRCCPDDIEQVVDFMAMFHDEIGNDQKTREEYCLDAATYIQSGNIYFWKNEQGQAVACCKFAPVNHLASVSMVFTHPAFRRRHYAENLVWKVTVIAKEAGYIPMLYTDADYAASNACYEKIGYVLRGKLCTIE